MNGLSILFAKLYIIPFTAYYLFYKKGYKGNIYIIVSKKCLALVFQSLLFHLP